MKYKMVTGVMLALLLIGVSTSAFNFKLVKANPQLLATTKLSISPGSIIGPPPSVGESFTINITITNVIDLTGWCIGLAWNASILNCTSWTTLFNTAVMGPSWHWLAIEGTINNTIGQVYPPYACALKAGYTMKSGNGTLAQVSFTVLDYGFTWINLTEVIIESNRTKIPVDLVNGTVTLAKPTPKLSISPASIVGPPPRIGGNFTVGIYIESVSNLASWQIGLKWDPTILNCTKWTTFFNTTVMGPPEDWLEVEGTINNTMGEVYPPYAYSLIAGKPPKSGSDFLAQVKFQVLGYGSTWINLTWVRIKSLIGGVKTEIPVDVTNGTFALFLIHDVAVTSVTLSATEAYPTGVNPLHIDVTIRNNGTEMETFTVTAYYNNIAIGTKTVTNMLAGNETTLTFTWNIPNIPKAFPYPIYIISANASLVPGEINTINNHLSVTVIVKWPGDANGDGHIDIDDLSLLADHWFETPTYDPSVDFNMNGKIRLLDLSILADYWFKGPLD